MKHEARSTKHEARSTKHEARSTKHEATLHEATLRPRGGNMAYLAQSRRRICGTGYLSPKRGFANRTEILKPASVWKYSDEWYTPREFVAQFGTFDLDPCAGPISCHAKRNIRPPRDGLKAQWSGRVWCNPPFSTLEIWAERFIEHGDGLLLLNARPETKWFQSIMERCDAVFVPRGRVPFHLLDGTRKTNIVGQAIFAIGKANVRSLHASKVPGLVLTQFEL